jgi:hypothetical protein
MAQQLQMRPGAWQQRKRKLLARLPKSRRKLASRAWRVNGSPSPSLSHQDHIYERMGRRAIEIGLEPFEYERRWRLPTSTVTRTRIDLWVLSR